MARRRGEVEPGHERVGTGAGRLVTGAWLQLGTLERQVTGAAADAVTTAPHVGHAPPNRAIELPKRDRVYNRAAIASRALQLMA